MGTVLVTGANRGIGLALCRQFHSRGDAVVAVCRESSPSLDALGVRVESGIDVTSDKSVAELAQRLKGTSLDVLINNAGTLSVETLEDMNFETIRRQFEVNSLGPLRVTRALRPCLGQGSKVIIITSQMGSIGEMNAGGYYGYRMSKAAVNVVGVCLAHDLSGAGIAVALLHPGYVSTDMTRHQGTVQPDDSARGLIARIDELTLENSGCFRHANGRSVSW
jgi:NAD(P)-dependent dehydrogenase (short-subunit alcohol dehydrogenase family)